MIINTNVSSITAQEAATNTGKSISSSLEKLSTGLKINKASDDASGLAIADKLRTQGTSIDQGVANGNSAVTLLQIADKSMSEQSNILDTVKAKLIQANTDTTSSDGREAIRKDINKLLEQLDNIAKQTNYNGTSLLQASRGDNSTSAGLSFQIGESDTDLITNTAIQSNTSGLGGKELALDNALADTTISENSGQLIKGDGTATVTLTGDNLIAASGSNPAVGTQVSVSGTIGTLDGTTDLTISNASAADVAILKDTTNITDNNDGTFTLAAADTASFTESLNSVTITSAALDAITLTPAANDRISVQSLNGETTIGSSVPADLDIGMTLSSLKDLGEGGLTTELADVYQSVIDTSITTLNGFRGDIGSTQNQVESAVTNLMTQSTNVKAAESIIRDVDYAAESANFNKQNIISQAGSYAISQANSVQQNVLKLLQ